MSILVAPRHSHVACAFVLWALLAGGPPAFAQITINIVSPQAGQPYGDPLSVSAGVSSASELTSVQATVAGHTIALTFSNGVWSGALPLTGVTRGPQQLTVSASNSGGQSAQALREFILDRLPVLTVAAPTNYALGQPDVRVAAQCADDGPTCTIKVSTDSTTLVVAAGSIDTFVRPPDGEVTLTIAAIDSTARSVETNRLVFVHSSTGLAAVGQFTGPPARCHARSRAGL